MRKSSIKWLAAAALAAFAGTGLAAPKAGEVTLLTGRGTATDPADGGIRELAKGEPLFAGEVISTAVNSYLNIRFADGSFVLLRPNSRFQIEAFEAAESAIEPEAAPAAPTQVIPAPGAPVTVRPAAPRPADSGGAQASAGTGSRAFFRLLKGGFRAVSGLIGKADRNEYRVSTPVATIGIRGTDYVAVICDAACASDPVVREDLPPGSASVEGGLIAGVIDGGIGVTGTVTVGDAPRPWPLTSAVSWLGAVAAVAVAPGQTVELGPKQWVAVLSNGQTVRIDRTPDFMIKAPIPDPTTCQ